MLNEENNKEMEIEENKQNIPDEQPLDNMEEKPEEKKEIKEKQKNKIIKRAPMEKTIDDNYVGILGLGTFRNNSELSFLNAL